LLSVTLGKGFAECISAFAECLRHSAKKLNPVVSRTKRTAAGNLVGTWQVLRVMDGPDVDE